MAQEVPHPRSQIKHCHGHVSPSSPFSSLVCHSCKLHTRILNNQDMKPPAESAFSWLCCFMSCEETCAAWHRYDAFAASLHRQGTRTKVRGASFYFCKPQTAITLFACMQERVKVRLLVTMKARHASRQSSSNSRKRQRKGQRRRLWQRLLVCCYLKMTRTRLSLAGRARSRSRCQACLPHARMFRCCMMHDGYPRRRR